LRVRTPAVQKIKMFQHFIESSSLRAYFSFIRNAFLSMLTYRLRYIIGILTYLIFVTVQYFIWRAAYGGDTSPSHQIHGFTFPEMITYVAVGWISRTMYYSDVDNEIEEIVRSGEITSYLIRPVNFQLMMIARALGETIFRLLFFTVPVGAAILSIYPILAPASILSLFLFIIATFGAFFILAEFNFLFGLLAFPLKSISGLIRGKYHLLQIVSGLLLPMAFFPNSIRAVLEFLPFHLLSSVPLQCYLGKLQGQDLAIAFTQLFGWAFVLHLLGMYFWNKAFSRLTVQGG
jgi:ABC-2 type transport system permease protein